MRGSQREATEHSGGRAVGRLAVGGAPNKELSGNTPPTPYHVQKPLGRQEILGSEAGSLLSVSQRKRGTSGPQTERAAVHS